MSISKAIAKVPRFLIRILLLPVELLCALPLLGAATGRRAATGWNGSGKKPN